MESIMYSQLFTQFSCLLALTIAIIKFHKWRCLKINTDLPLPPGPFSYPIIGCLPDMIKNKPTFQWIHQTMQEMKVEIACFRFGNSFVIPVTSPELACEFLKKHDAIFSSRPKAISAKVVSDGYLSTIFSPYGDQWKKMRRVLVSKVLSSSMHKQLHDKRCAEADVMMRHVYNQCQNPLHNGLVNVRMITQHYCGSVIKKLIFNKSSFGTRKNDGEPGIEDMEHMDATFTILSYLYGFAIADFVPCLEVFDFDGHKKIMIDALHTMRKYQDPKIDKRVEIWKQGIRNAEEDILDMLINLKDSENNPSLTIKEIKAQITEIMLATVDNPSNAVEFTLAEMINQPSILDKAYNELDQIVGRDRLVQESDLLKLNYIKACAKESFRLHPIAPFNIPHVSSKDIVVGEYFIPKGSQVLLSRLGLGRNPRVWDEPLRYNPERHISNNQKPKEVELVDHELRMLSFSTGRRGCPGIILGSTLTTILLARLIQGFHWKASPHGSATINLIKADSHGLLMHEPLIAHATPRLDRQVIYKSDLFPV